MGGGMLEDIPEEGETLKLKGSVMLAWAESKEQVMKEIEQDVYFKNDVWDKSKHANSKQKVTPIIRNLETKDIKACEDFDPKNTHYGVVFTA
ncbi:MAG: hypothetical protein M1821_006032 [Bathelium mastoideum]|nr:MAG: hypothetical protein M1821_006032 [Bathelium mastoideum]